MDKITVKKIMMKYKFSYIKLLLLKSFNELSNILIAFTFGFLIQGAAKKNYEELIIGVIVSSIILLVAPVLSYISDCMTAKLNQNVIYDIRQHIIDSYMDSKPEQFRKSDSGSKISVLTNDTEALYSDFLNNIFWIWHFSFMLVATVISLFCISIYMAIVMIALTAISFYFSSKGLNNIESINEKRLEALSNHTNAINEFINGYDVVHDFKLQNYSHKKMKQLFDISKKRYMDYKKNVLKQESVGMFFGGIVFMGGFIIGSVFVYYSILPLGMLITCIQLSNNLNQPIYSLIGLTTQFKASKNTIKKLNDLLEDNARKNEESISKGNKEDYDIKNYDLSLRSLLYRYPESSFSLGPITSDIKHGKKICILGHSGSGKSTILKLLKKDKEYLEGDIRLGELSYKKIDANKILDYIGVVSQNVFVFKTSIKNNIALFNENIDDEKIKNAMKQAGLEEFIDKIDDTNLIEELGGSLSGGEKQRISIARCLANNKPIIIADEAFSALDNKLAFEIEKELLNLEEKTFVNITHRLFPKNLDRYDEIWVLNKGKVVTKGKYEEIKDEENISKFIKYF